MITDGKSQTAINKLKKGKVSENSDIRVEDTENYDAAKKEKVKYIFNEVLNQESLTPET